ncbi:nuclear pore complex protein NUP160 isoform X3 [Ananas comosus]|uniref:Nuclear pore complex protein NUP160 isoform X3 n=1 Tax=Ananas comosus TaxID=4615 RepID=A0A6P5F1V1_ANACO|nr:nuclear pore complex protein NUP160 isoform X3 [Ananas comosus]
MRIWRLHKNLPSAIEVIDISTRDEFPEIGLRLVFQEPLHPFALLCKDEVERGTGDAYLLYVLTTSGVAFVCKLHRPFSYISGSIFPPNDLVEFNVQTHSQSGKITAVTATSGCLVIGRHDGSIGCYQLGRLDPNAPGFSGELRDDIGIGRLWNLVSRAKVVGAVQDMVISEIHGRKLLFVLHMSGNLRVWDLLSHTRVFYHNISSNELQESYPSRLWVGEANYDKQLISLAVLHQGALVPDFERVVVYSFNFRAGDRSFFSPEPSMYNIPLEEGRVIDLKISSRKLWMLKEIGPMLYEITQWSSNLENTCTYILQEDFVSEQLFQSSEHALDDLIWNNTAIFSSPKDQTVYFISSIFLRRLLQPGVHQYSALRETILEHKYLPDSEFRSLTVDGLRQEILAIIESEGAATNATATVYYWKNFCARFFNHWCQSSRPYGLLVDFDSDTLGLIRKGSVSLFRSLVGVEELIYGSSDEMHNLHSTGMNTELLFEVLRCMSHINNQLGRSAAALYYESLVSPIISSDDIIHQLLKILETGFSPSSSTSLVAQLGADAYLERRQLAHKSQRKFAVEMLLSLRSLHTKASNWTTVLDVVEKYLVYLSPPKSTQKSYFRRCYNVNSSVLVQATSQVARAMFESAFDLLLLLGYLVNVSGQVAMMQTDVVSVNLNLIPMAQDVLKKWLILHFTAITPTKPPAVEDFSSQLSSLHIGNNADKLSLNKKLGSVDFTLACLLDLPTSSEGQDILCSSFLLNPIHLIDLVRKFSSSILWGKSGEQSPVFSSPMTDLASVLLQDGQYEAAKNLFDILDIYSRNEKVSQIPASNNVERYALSHLRGFCLLLLAHNELTEVLKERKMREAIRCFFRAASGQEAPQALQSFSSETGFHISECGSEAMWKLHYYQWAMQIFEQYGMSEGASQFALAALEQVDAIVGVGDGDEADYGLPEPATTIRGRLWSNVFKYALDLKHFKDAYCAIVSNTDDDSKYICLRRFVIVLCELGAIKVLCDGEIPFVGLVEKLEQELSWKAERSDISSRPNLYKVLYAFHANRNNWRKAASYMYRYSMRLKKEANLRGSSQTISSSLQERLYALSTALNALQLVDHAHAWIDSQNENEDEESPNKKPRNILVANSASLGIAPQSRGLQFCVDVEALEKEYVLTSAQYMLSLADDKFKISGRQELENLVDVLIQENFYDMAFTVIIKIWKGSALKRELERAFVAIAQDCCSNAVSPAKNHVKSSNLLLLYSEDGMYDGKSKSSPAAIDQIKGNGQWEALELYLEKYRKLHPRLPVTVAETLLYTDPQIELPLWLVQMFKGGRRVTSWGMTGRESDPATLFRLYVDYGRHAEATNLLLEYLESFASLRPADVINRKKMSAIWFPYTTIERLWCQLEEMQSAGRMVDQCDKLKQLLRGALSSHLMQVEVDSIDVLSSVPARQMDSSSS